MSHLDDLDRLYAVVKEKHGHIDILFANAGAGTIAPLAAATEAHFDQTFDVNVKGLFFSVQKALPLSRRRFDYPDLFGRQRVGGARFQHLRREQGGGAQLRARLDTGAERTETSASTR